MAVSMAAFCFSILRGRFAAPQDDVVPVPPRRPGVWRVVHIVRYSVDEAI
jgi:hypothetical protein